MKLATKPGVPIIPVTIDGSYKFFEENGCITPCDIHMIIHEPIETAGLDRKAEKELHAKVEAIILDGLRELGAIE
jgi:1-acyl-sn-glycerol-3-phosphate acyltransferase